MTEKPSLDVKAIRLAARRDWEKATRKRMRFTDRAGESIPWWLVIVAGVFFLLSIPHTIDVFNIITPRVGYVAPFGVEFGLLYAAFRRRQLHRVSWQLFILELLLFVTSVIVNGAGSLQAVIAATSDVQGMSFEALVSDYRTLPVISQVALLLVPVAALIIPIGTTVAGDGLASLFLEGRGSGNWLEARWKDEQGTVEFEALRDAALLAGHTPAQAARWAEQIAYAGRPQMSAPDRPGHADAADVTDTRGHGTGQGYSKNMSAREAARQYLADNPDAAALSVRALADEVGIGKTVAAEVLAEHRAFGIGSRNGHGE